MSGKLRKPWFADLAAFVRFDEPLARHTSFGIGGPAACFAEPRTVDELKELLQICARHGVPWRVLGGGTNVLAADAGFDGVVIHLSRAGFGSIRRRDGTARCGAAASLPRLVRLACLQWHDAAYAALAGIPGSVGGALRMNAGGRHGSIGDRVRSVLVLDPRRGESRTLVRPDIEFGYRTSSLTDVIVLNSELCVTPGSEQEAAAAFEEMLAAKRRSQPWRDRSAGCVFANPAGQAGDPKSAGWLIDQAGLKGKAIGGALVSDLHANFIINRGSATAADVLSLIDDVRKNVKAAHAVELPLEIEIW